MRARLAPAGPSALLGRGERRARARRQRRLLNRGARLKHPLSELQEGRVDARAGLGGAEHVDGADGLRVFLRLLQVHLDTVK